MPRKAKTSKTEREKPSESDDRLERMQVEPVAEEQQQQQSDYEEYYALDRYAMDKWNDEFYARNSRTGEIYLKDKNTGKPIFAKRRNDDHEFEEFPASDHLGRLRAAADDDGKHHYPKKAGGGGGGHVIPNSGSTDGYLIDDEGNEIYPRDGDNREYYVKDSNGNPIFARRVTGEQFYATCERDGDVVEYLPEGPDDSSVFIRLSEDEDEYYFQYPINRTKQRPLYHQDVSTGDPVYIGLRDTTQYYGKNAVGDEIYGVNINNGNESYARDKNGTQILAKLRDGTPYYAKWSNGEEIYPMNVDGQYYKTVNNVEMCALNPQGSPVYAKNNSQDEVYPKRWLTTTRRSSIEG